MRKTAIVLVDFDNIEKSLRDDLDKLEKTLYGAVSRKDFYSEIILRLYGGWFHTINPSIAAARLSPWVYGFPHVIGKTIVNGEMVRSLGFEKHNLPYTFRKRSKPILFQVDKTKMCRTDNSCDLYRLNQALDKGVCSSLGCRKEFKNAFLVNEQKLIDTMISTDLIYLSESSPHDIFLVSSDDDFIPALRYVSHKGSIVNVIHTQRAAYRFKSEYTDRYTSQIIEGNL